MKLRVQVDRNSCCGHGRCYSAHPDLFQPDELGESVPVAEVVDADRRDDLMAAVAGCPEEAITVAPVPATSVLG